jgi:hypothetical protein
VRLYHSPSFAIDSMSGALNAGPKAALVPLATRLRQIALVTKDLERTQQLLV